FMRTATGNHWLISTALPDDTAARLDTVLAEEPVLMPEDWESSEPRCLEVARALIAPFRRPGGAGSEYRGPAYAFPEGLVGVGVAEDYTPDDEAAAIAVDLAWIATASEVEQPIVVAREEGGRIVSVCHAARATSEGAEAGLATTIEARRHGHAIAVTSH